MRPPPNLRIIEKDGVGTLYRWKGRNWSLLVPSPEYQRLREETALREARMKVEMVEILKRLNL